MASEIKLPVTFRNTLADAVATRAGNGAKLRIYDGTKPATADTAVSSQVLLAELTCGSPFAGSASGGVCTANAITQDSNANAGGTATWYRLVQSDGTTVVCDGTVGTSGCDLNLVSTTISATQPVQVTALTYTAMGA